MTTGSAARILRSPGRLVANPTDLGLNFPHGGVQVGLVRAVVLQPLGTPYVVASEGLGAPSDVLQPMERWTFGCVLRGWDRDALEALQPFHHATGAVTGEPVFQAPGSALAGRSSQPRGLPLLFSPDNPTEAPAALLYSAVPFFTEGAELAFQRAEEFAMPLAAECLRDSQGRTLEVGLLADLTL